MIEVHLTEEDLKKLKKKKIGQGKEGKVYKVSRNPNLLFKIYYKVEPHEREEKIHFKIKEYDIDAEGVKRVIDSDKRIDFESLVRLNAYYIDNEGVKKVYSYSQIETALQRQDKVKKSSLPLGPIYIDNKLAGVVLKYHRKYIDLHTISLLPVKTRLKILQKVLIRIKELCDNHIYPIDFANKDEESNYPHSNILINIFGDVQFIDLEGNTTVYTTEYNKYYEEYAYSEFYFLFLDIIYDKKLPRNATIEDIEYMESLLKCKGIPDEYIKYLYDKESIDYNISEKLIENFKLNKKNKNH